MPFDLIIAILLQLGISFTQIGTDQIQITNDKESHFQKNEALPIVIHGHIVIVDSDIIR